MEQPFQNVKVPGFSDIIRGAMHARQFDKLGGVNLKLVYPADEASKELAKSSKDGNIEAHLANFGHYQFGSSITAALLKLTHNTTACGPISSQEDLDEQEQGNLSKNGFILVEAGDCSFETKARNVEQFGGQVAVIIEQPEMSFSSQEEQKDLEILNDDLPFTLGVIYDGTGNSITIPTVVISYEHGERLK